MSHQPSKRILQMTESATFAMSAKAIELKEEGRNIVSLSVGESDFNAPDFIRAAAKEAIDGNYDIIRRCLDTVRCVKGLPTSSSAITG